MSNLAQFFSGSGADTERMQAGLGLIENDRGIFVRAGILVRGAKAAQIRKIRAQNPDYMVPQFCMSSGNIAVGSIYGGIATLGSIVLIYETGQLLRTTNAFATVTAVDFGIQNIEFISNCRATANAFFISGNKLSDGNPAIWRSTDGLTWTMVFEAVRDTPQTLGSGVSAVAMPISGFMMDVANDVVFALWCVINSAGTGYIPRAYYSLDNTGLLWSTSMSVGSTVTYPSTGGFTFTGVGWNGTAYGTFMSQYNNVAGFSSQQVGLYTSNLASGFSAGGTGFTASLSMAGQKVVSTIIVASNQAGNTDVGVVSGATLTGQTGNSGGTMIDVVYNGTRFVWSRNTGTTYAATLHGVATAITGGGVFTKMVVIGTTIVAMNASGIWSSADGITFTARTLPSDATLPSEGLTSPYSPAMVVSGANVYVRTRHGGLIQSTDNGTTWTWALPQIGVTATRRNLDQCNNFIFTGGTSLVRMDCSGENPTWTMVDANSYNQVAFGNGVYVAVGAAGLVKTSPDGITWTTRSGVTGVITGVAYNATLNRWRCITTSNTSFLSNDNGATWSAGATHTAGGAAGRLTFITGHGWVSYEPYATNNATVVWTLKDEVVGTWALTVTLSTFPTNNPRIKLFSDCIAYIGDASGVNVVGGGRAQVIFATQYVVDIELFNNRYYATTRTTGASGIAQAIFTVPSDSRLVGNWTSQSLSETGLSKVAFSSASAIATGSGQEGRLIPRGSKLLLSYSNNNLKVAGADTHFGGLFSGDATLQASTGMVASKQFAYKNFTISQEILNSNSNPLCFSFHNLVHSGLLLADTIHTNDLTPTQSNASASSTYRKLAV
jgi:hypothetical protein